jgi:TrkA-N domain
MSAMAEPGTAQHAPRQHVVVVGADSTTVRLAEELVRSGEQLVVIAHGENPRGAIADIEALGCQMIIANQIREVELRAAGVERARAAVVLGDDDVLALRLGLMIDELAPGLRIVIEMTNPRLGGRLTSLIGDCTLLSSAELAAPAFVAAALATPDTQSFEIGGRTVAAGPRHRIGGELLAVIGDTRRTGIDAVLPQNGGDLVLGTKLIGTARNVARTSGMLGAVSRIFDRRARLACWQHRRSPRSRWAGGRT